jgi:ubiquinone/menaquinone biosynthesis C-methylase UbiE
MNEYDIFLNKLNLNYEQLSSTILRDREEASNLCSEYWEIFLGDITSNLDLAKDMYRDKFALDYGSGSGRNIINLLNLIDFARVDGVDISKNLVEGSKRIVDNLFSPSKSNIYHTVGDTIPTEDNIYDLIISYTVLQHIPSYSVRLNILKEMYRTLVPGGKIILQLVGKTKNTTNVCTYYQDMYQQIHFNGSLDFVVAQDKDLFCDLEMVGFKNIDITRFPAPQKDIHLEWIKVVMTK